MTTTRAERTAAYLAARRRPYRFADTPAEDSSEPRNEAAQRWHRGRVLPDHAPTLDEADNDERGN